MLPEIRSQSQVHCYMKYWLKFVINWISKLLFLLIDVIILIRRMKVSFCFLYFCTTHSKYL